MEDVEQFELLGPYIAVIAIIAGGFTLISKIVTYVNSPQPPARRGDNLSLLMEVVGAALVTVVGLAALIIVITT